VDRRDRKRLLNRIRTQKISEASQPPDRLGLKAKTKGLGRSCHERQIDGIICIMGGAGEWSNHGGDKMAVARVTEIIASSTKSFDAAVSEGLNRASKTLRGITGLHVVSMKAAVENGKISEYRVQMNITFILED